MSKEWLTLQHGANAAGEFKLKLLNKNQSLVIFRFNKNAWMTKATVRDWFKNHFCNEVKNIGEAITQATRLC